jgi:hypothetical protein
MYAPPGSGGCVPYFSQPIPQFNAYLFSLFTLPFADYLLLNVSVAAVTLASGAALPSWLSLNASDQLLAGVPPSGARGTYSLNVSLVSQDDGSVATMLWALVIPNRSPRVLNSTLLQVPTGRSQRRFNTLFVDDDGDSWVVSQHAVNLTYFPPPYVIFVDMASQQLTVNAVSGDQGLYYLNFTVTDTLNGTSVFVFTVEILNQAPALNVQSAMPPPVVTVGTEVVYALQTNAFRDADGDDISLSVSYPYNLVLYPSLLSFVIKPTAAHYGNYTLNITATDTSIDSYPMLAAYDQL